MDIMILIGVGLLAGMLSGLFGIGGGIIIVPALIYIARYSQITAQGTSLVALLPPVGLLAFLHYYRNGHVDLKAGIIIAFMLFIGAFFGSKLSHQLPVEVLRKSFALFMIVVAIKMFFK